MKQDKKNEYYKRVSLCLNISAYERSFASSHAF